MTALTTDSGSDSVVMVVMVSYPRERVSESVVFSCCLTPINNLDSNGLTVRTLASTPERKWNNINWDDMTLYFFS